MLPEGVTSITITMHIDEWILNCHPRALLLSGSCGKNAI